MSAVLPDSLEFGPFRLDAAKRVLWRAGELVPLPPKALDLLLALVAGRGDVVTKEALLREVWPDTFVEEANLSVNVSVLRKTLGRQASGAEYIETIPRRGYRFAAGVGGPLPRPSPRLAVLPFRLLGASQDEAYLGVAMADAVITRLGRIGEIDVRPTSAVLEYAERSVDLEQVGRHLAVDSVLDGRLQLAGDRLRVTVQLVAVPGAGARWADSFDEARGDILAVQDAVAERVAGALVRQLSAAQREQLAERGTSSVEAYQAYAKGRYFWSRLSSAWIEKACACFLEAAELDPHYAAPHAGLAEAYLVLGFSGLVPPREAWEMASGAARRSLELDRGSAEALVALAWVRLFEDWAWSEAAALLAEACERRPVSAAGHEWRALLQLIRGRHAEAWSALDRAAALDPTSAIASALRALHALVIGDSERQLEEAQQTVELAPGQFLGHWSLGLAFQALGRFDEAVAEHRLAVELSEQVSFMVCVLARSLALAGEQAEARERLQAAENGPAPQACAYQRATVHLALGERELALRRLEEACEARDPWTILLRVDPMLDALRGEARFQALVERVFGAAPSG